MNKPLALLFLAASNPVLGVVLVSDDFPDNGTLAGQTPAIGGLWTSISGTAGQIQVVNGQVLLSDSASEDVTSLFDPVSSGSLYFGMDLIVNDPGSYSGTDFEYFTHFDGSGFTARTDIAAFSVAGYRPGIATTSSAAESVWGSDLVYGSKYRIVVGYDFGTGFASLWVDPTSISDTSITSTTSVNVSLLDGFNFRQSSASPNLDLSIGGLRVATTFPDAAAVPEPATVAAAFAIISLGFVFFRRRQS